MEKKDKMKKAYMVRTNGCMTTGVTWAETRSKAMWLAVRSYCDAGLGNEREALMTIRIYRDLLFDDRCPDLSKRIVWDLDYVVGR